MRVADYGDVLPVSETKAAKLRVLVVEDTDANRKLLVGLLSRLGYTANGVEHGKACVDLFTEWRQASKAGEPFDLVLM